MKRPARNTQTKHANAGTKDRVEPLTLASCYQIVAKGLRCSGLSNARNSAGLTLRASPGLAYRRHGGLPGLSIPL